MPAGPGDGSALPSLCGYSVGFQGVPVGVTAGVGVPPPSPPPVALPPLQSFAPEATVLPEGTARAVPSGEAARYGEPPLTTVRRPVSEQT